MKFIVFVLCMIFTVFAGFCDTDKFLAAVEEAKTCMETTDACTCLRNEKQMIIDAECATEPIKTFFKDGCLTFSCTEEDCSF